MGHQRGQTAPPRSSLTPATTSRSTTPLSSLLTDYFVPKDRAELRATRPKVLAELQRQRKIIHRIVRISPFDNLGGYVHGAFPSTYLQYWLLTEEELDSLATFYGQDRGGNGEGEYPKRWGYRREMRMEDKRRGFGRFLGFRGCEGGYRVLPNVESFKRRVEDMVAQWRFPEMPGKPHRPSDGLAERVAKKVLALKRGRIEKAVTTICEVDKAMAERAGERVGELKPRDGDACGGMRKGWREKVKDSKGRK